MIEIPNYEIGKLAGRGGVAEVYLATHKLLDRVVAIKIISPTKAGELADKRFLKEARVVAGLRHPNIVSIYDVGVLENKYYIIMEYLEGGDLKQHVKKEISAARSLDILKQIGSALAHAHDKGFIHRDIKSQNIMFRADGTAVLTDFGIVKDLTADTGYTLDGTSIGTPHYMSPEQAQGASTIDYRTDLYSLGVTFYEMLTGSVPYQADSAVAVALKHIKDPVPQLPVHLSRYQAIIDRLMAKKPEKRFQSAHELIEALDKLESLAAKDIPTQTLEYTHRTAFKPRKAGLKPRLGFLIAALAVAGVLAAFLIFAPPYVSQLIDEEIPVKNHSLQATSPPDPGKESAGEEKAAESDGKLPSTEKVPEAKPEPEASFSGEGDAAEPNRFFDRAPLTRAITNRNYSEALNAIKKLRRQMPASANEMLDKADNFLAAGQYINAGDVYNTLLSVEPENVSAVLGLLYAAIDKQKELERIETPTVKNFETQLAFLKKGIEKTDSPLFTHLKINTVEAIYELARNRLTQDAFTPALEMAEVGLRYAPEHLRLKKLRLLTMAQVSFNDERLTLPEGDNALAYYRRVLALDSEDMDARQGLSKIVDWFKEAAQTAYQDKNYAKAIQHIEKACSIAPDHKALKGLEWMIRGDMHYERAEYELPENENARFFYRKVLAEFPENEQAALRLDKIDVLGPLSEASQKGPLSGKIALYRDAFQSLQAAVAAHGSEEMADVEAAVSDSINAAVEEQKRRLTEIPDEFINLVTSHFPKFDSIFSAQYEILIVKGDNQKTMNHRVDFYLKALKFNPARAQAKKKLKTAANDLDKAGKPNEAMAVLGQAMGISSNEAEFKKLYKDIKKSRDAKAELFTTLYQIKTIQPFEEKIGPYGKLFAKLKTAIDEYGREKMAGVRQGVTARLKTDIEFHKTNRREIPEVFSSLVAEYFPELENDIINAQYDILMVKGKEALPVDKKAHYFLQALSLNPKRPEASEKIRGLARTVYGNGKYQTAVKVLKQAMDVAPADNKIAEFYQSIHREVEIYPTGGGCGRENIISEMPVTRECLNLCIHYRNLTADSIVNVMFARKEEQSFEVPVVLNGRSGNKPITVSAPVEGFAVGEYSIVVKQNANILSEAKIQFIPKRR